MVTAERVWEALAEVPDPEIPVISLVDLGVVRDVEVDDGRVRVEFTPTFLGCPAVDVMRDRMEEAVRALGGEPQIDVVLDDSWSTDRITPAGREKLRESGFAPPAPREAAGPTLVQLESHAFRCPYCGSTDTRLENIFGPTPCRSIRWCATCRQPFDNYNPIEPHTAARAVLHPVRDCSHPLAERDQGDLELDQQRLRDPHRRRLPPGLRIAGGNGERSEDERQEHDGPVPDQEAERDVSQREPGCDEPPQVVALEEPAVEKQVHPGGCDREVGGRGGRAPISHV